MNAAGPTGGAAAAPVRQASIRIRSSFVQCVGSTMQPRCAEKGKEYCSKICCMYTAKHAMLIAR